MSLARNILGNTFIQFGGKIITAAFSVVVLKMITSYLGTSGYGDYTAVYNFLAFFGIAADFGIFTITVKEMSKKDADLSMILGNALGLRTLLVILTMSLAVMTAFLIPKYNGTLIPMGVAVATAATFLNLLNGTISSVLQVKLKMQYETLGMILGKIISLGYMALVIYFWMTQDTIQGFYHLLWAGAIGNGIMLLVTGFYARRYAKISYRFDFAFWKKLFITSLPYGVALVLSNLYFRMDVVLMTLILPHSSTLANGAQQCAQQLCSDSQAGLYGVAMRFLEMLVIIPVYFMNAVLPLMTLYVEENREKLKKLVQYAFDFLSASALPIMVGGILLALPIVQLIASPEFIGGETYRFGSETAIRILMVAMMLSFLSNLFGFTLVALNQQKKLMWINLGGVILNLSTNLLAIPLWGFVGAASASVICGLFILILTARSALNYLDMKIDFRTSGKAFLAALCMGLVLGLGYWWMREWHFALQLALLIPLGSLIYGGVIWQTKAVTPEMWALLRKKKE